MTNVVLVTFAVFLADTLRPGSLTDVLALHVDIYRQPWQILPTVDLRVRTWRHLHIGLNMFMLWMFGRVIEERLGRQEFLLFYLIAIVFSGLVWVIMELLEQGTAGIFRPVVGASGGVVAVFIMFVLYYPKQTVYVWGLVAVPAWVIGVLVIGSDLISGVRGTAGSTAWEAHLGGAAFAFLYLKSGLKFCSVLARPRSFLGSCRVADPSCVFTILVPTTRSWPPKPIGFWPKYIGKAKRASANRERRTLEKYSRRVRDRRD